MDPKRLLERLRAGHVQNVRFTDLLDLAEGLGFELDGCAEAITSFATRRFEDP